MDYLFAQVLPSGLITSLGNRRGRRSNIDEKLTELRVDMLVASLHEVFDVVDDFQHGAAFVERLGRHSRPIAIVNTVVPSLKDRLKSFLKQIVRGDSRLMLVGIIHSQVI